MNWKLVLAHVVVAAALCSRATAQDRPRIWMGLGVGGGGGHDVAGVGLMGEIVYQKRAHHFAVRGLLLGDLFASDVIGELGVLYGRAATRPWGHATIAGGIAYTSVEPRDNFTTSGCTALGVPVVAETALRLASVVGVGAQVFVNFNSKTIYRGAMVFLQLGWIP